jgi:hypothetical protein
MKEVLTKSFWQGVKKTFYEALEPEPEKKNASQVQAAGQQNASTPPSELPPDPPPPPAAPADN